MHPLPIAQDVFTVLVVLLAPLISIRPMNRLKRHTSTEARIGFYRRVIWKLWPLAAGAALLAYPTDIYVLPHDESVARWLAAHPHLYLLACVSVAAYSLIVLGQGFRGVVDSAWRRKLAKAMRTLRFALPVSSRERRYWIVVSLSAGICEELLFRGFLMHYLSGSLAGGMALGVAGAWLVSSVFFGLAHAYQGITGIIRATVSGLLLGLVAILTGQLALPMLLHALFDLQVLWGYRPTRDDPDAAVKLAQGCAPCEL